MREAPYIYDDEPPVDHIPPPVYPPEIDYIPPPVYVDAEEIIYANPPLEIPGIYYPPTQTVDEILTTTAVSPEVNCNCLWGTAYIDADGNCRCHNDGIPEEEGPWPIGTGGVKPDRNLLDANGNIKGGGYVVRDPRYGGVRALPQNTDRQTTATTAATATSTTDTASGLPFGLSPLALLGIAAGGLFILSSMSEEPKTAKGGVTK